MEKLSQNKIDNVCYFISHQMVKNPAEFENEEFYSRATPF